MDSATVEIILERARLLGPWNYMAVWNCVHFAKTGRIATDGELSRAEDNYWEQRKSVKK